MRKTAVVGAVSALLLLAGAWSRASAQQPATAGQAANPSGYEVNIAPYIWFPTVNTSLKYNLPPELGGKLPTDVSVGPGDIYSHLDIGAMFSADVRTGPFSLLTDLIYARFSATTSNVNIKSIDFFGLPSMPISRALETSTGTTLRETIWTLAGGYTVLQRDWGNLDIFAGFRFLNVNSRTEFQPGADHRRTSRQRRDFWRDRQRFRLAERLETESPGFSRTCPAGSDQAVHSLLFRHWRWRIAAHVAGLVRAGLSVQVGRRLGAVSLPGLRSARHVSRYSCQSGRSNTDGDAHLLDHQFRPWLVTWGAIFGASRPTSGRWRVPVWWTAPPANCALRCTG